MKKIFSMLIGLILLASVFGVVSTTATVNGFCHCTQENFFVNKASIRVGETFTITKYKYCIYNENPNPGTLEEMLEFVSVKTDGNWEIVTFRALRPGTITYTNSLCNDVHVVTIASKDYPMLSFMKLLGFGKKE
jgi:hypothetical protein